MTRKLAVSKGEMTPTQQFIHAHKKLVEKLSLDSEAYAPKDIRGLDVLWSCTTT